MSVTFLLASGIEIYGMNDGVEWAPAAGTEPTHPITLF